MIRFNMTGSAFVYHITQKWQPCPIMHCSCPYITTIIYDFYQSIFPQPLQVRQGSWKGIFWDCLSNISDKLDAIPICTRINIQYYLKRERTTKSTEQYTGNNKKCRKNLNCLGSLFFHFLPNYLIYLITPILAYLEFIYHFDENHQGGTGGKISKQV